MDHPARQVLVRMSTRPQTVGSSTGSFVMSPAGIAFLRQARAALHADRATFAIADHGIALVVHEAEYPFGGMIFGSSQSGPAA